MCLVVSNKRHTKTNFSGKALPFIADRPLIVLKRARKISSSWRDGYPTVAKYESPYQHTPIALEAEYTTTLDARKGYSKTSVERGFHCYLFDSTAQAWDDRPTLSRNDMVSLLGVIPPGATYYIGTDREVVTDKIMYFENMEKLKAYYGIEDIAAPYKGQYREG